MSCRIRASSRKRIRIGWSPGLVLRPMHSALLVAEDAPCIGGGELPIDAAAVLLRAEVPGAGTAAQLGEGRHAVPSEAFARPQAHLDLGGVEPARVLGR